MPSPSKNDWVDDPYIDAMVSELAEDEFVGEIAEPSVQVSEPLNEEMMDRRWKEIFTLTPAEKRFYAQNPHIVKSIKDCFNKVNRVLKRDDYFKMDNILSDAEKFDEIHSLTHGIRMLSTTFHSSNNQNRPVFPTPAVPFRGNLLNAHTAECNCFASPQYNPYFPFTKTNSGPIVPPKVTNPQSFFQRPLSAMCRDEYSEPYDEETVKKYEKFLKNLWKKPKKQLAPNITNFEAKFISWNPCLTTWSTMKLPSFPTVTRPTSSRDYSAYWTNPSFPTMPPPPTDRHYSTDWTNPSFPTMPPPPTDRHYSTDWSDPSLPTVTRPTSSRDYSAYWANPAMTPPTTGPDFSAFQANRSFIESFTLSPSPSMSLLSCSDLLRTSGFSMPDDSPELPVVLKDDVLAHFGSLSNQFHEGLRRFPSANIPSGNVRDSVIGGFTVPNPVEAYDLAVSKFGRPCGDYSFFKRDVETKLAFKAPLNPRLYQARESRKRVYYESMFSNRYNDEHFEAQSEFPPPFILGPILKTKSCKRRPVSFQFKLDSVCDPRGDDTIP